MTDRIQKIQIFGERCSGTNYLERLLAQNLRNVTIQWEFGWKHWFHRPGIENATDCLFVVIYRNPFDWIRSLHRNPWHANRALRGIPFGEFIRREWWCVWDEHADIFPGDPQYGQELMMDRCPETGQRFANVLRMRTAKIRNWKSLEDLAANSIQIRYEEISSDPDRFLTTMSEQFRIKRKRLFLEVAGEKGRGGVYTRKTYSPICPEDRQHLMQELDQELEQAIGYRLDGRDNEMLSTALPA